MMAQYLTWNYYPAVKQNVLCGEVGSASISAKWEISVIAFSWWLKKGLFSSGSLDEEDGTKETDDHGRWQED